MDILGIGASELLFILLIAIIVLGPRDMQKAGRSVGRWLNQFVRSDGWKALQRASKEIRSLPTNLMREANLEELREMDREIRNNIDPRPRPPEPKKNSEPSTANPGQTPSQSPSTAPTSDQNPEQQ